MLQNKTKQLNNSIELCRENDGYYEGVASAFRFAKFVALFIGVLFFVIMLSLFKSEISIENFQYVLKYISTEEDTLITTKKIHYPTSDSKALSLYKGDFVSSGPNGISLYDTNGSTVLEIEETFSKPVFSLGKYGMCYDLGANKFVIFNTFSKLYSASSEYPIAGAVMSDDGNFAVLTKDREYRSVIKIYNEDYEHVSSVYKDKYTFNIDLTEESLVYTAVTAVDSRYLTEVYVMNLNTNTEALAATLFDEFPLDVKFTETGFTLICDRSIRFYDKDNNETVKFIYASNTPGGVFTTDKYATLYFKKNMIGSENDVRIYDFNGKLVFNEVLSGKINSLDMKDNVALIHTNNSVYRIDLDNKLVQMVECDSGAEKIMLQSDNSALLCFKNHANLIDFSNIALEYQFY